MEEMIYEISLTNISFTEQLKMEQNSDAITRYTKSCVENGSEIGEGQLRRVAK